jgi:hypothetical protein
MVAGTAGAHTASTIRACKPDRVTEVRHAKVSDRVAGRDLFHGLEFLFGGGQGRFQAGDFAQPALATSFGDAVGEIVVNLLQARHLSGIWPQEWTAYAAMLVRTRGPKVAGAHAERDFA